MSEPVSTSGDFGGIVYRRMSGVAAARHNNVQVATIRTPSLIVNSPPKRTAKGSLAKTVLVSSAAGTVLSIHGQMQTLEIPSRPLTASGTVSMMGLLKSAAAELAATASISVHGTSALQASPSRQNCCLWLHLNCPHTTFSSHFQRES